MEKWLEVLKEERDTLLSEFRKTNIENEKLADSICTICGYIEGLKLGADELEAERLREDKPYNSYKKDYEN